MRRKALYILLILLFSNCILKSQSIETEKISKSLIFLEAGGYGGYGSLNYEYLLYSNNRLKVSSRLGLGTYHLNDYTNEFNPDIILPIAVSGYYGNNHNVDLGVGQTFSSIVYADKTNYQPQRINSFSTNLSIGYRYQKKTGGFMFRIAYTPIIEQNKHYRNWYGISFGYAF